MPARKKLKLALGKASRPVRGRGKGRREIHVQAEEHNFPYTYQVSAVDDDAEIEKEVRAVGRFHAEKVRRTREFAQKHERKPVASVAEGEVVCTDMAIRYKAGCVEVEVTGGILHADPGIIPKRVAGCGPHVLVFNTIDDVPTNAELMVLLAERINAAAASDEVEETDRAQREQSLKGRLEVDE